MQKQLKHNNSPLKPSELECELFHRIYVFCFSEITDLLFTSSLYLGYMKDLEITSVKLFHLVLLGQCVVNILLRIAFHFNIQKISRTEILFGKYTVHVFIQINKLNNKNQTRNLVFCPILFLCQQAFLNCFHYLPYYDVKNIVRNFFKVVGFLNIKEQCLTLCRRKEKSL